MQHDRKNLENKVFRKELYELGEALVYAIYKESLAHGAIFVLVTQIKELHEGALKRQILSLDVSRALSNPCFALPDNLQHINESGNGVLAWEIAKFLQAYQLIPTKHLIAESYLWGSNHYSSFNRASRRERAIRPHERPEHCRFSVRTGSFTSESPFMSPFWPLIPEIFPVLLKWEIDSVPVAVHRIFASLCRIRS